MSERAAAPPVPFIGLTGAVAAGKSEALAAFARLGAQTLSTDLLVHEILSSAEVAERIAERWGDEAAPGGSVDRGRVGAIVFERPDELGWLESVLHPLVGQRTLEWRAGLPDDTKLGVVEVPLLFETGMESAFDATVCIVADDETRARRGGARGTELLAEREAKQLSQSEKASRATYVVANDGTPADLEAALAELIPKLTTAGGPE